MIWLGTVSNYVGKLYLELICFRFVYQTWFVITFIRTLMMKSICELYVICGMYVESCTILVVVNRLSRPVVVLDGLPGLYGLKYESATALRLPLYLCSYKLDDFVTSSAAVLARQCRRETVLQGRAVVLWVEFDICSSFILIGLFDPYRLSRDPTLTSSAQITHLRTRHEDINCR